jgi:hypothetical protein
MIEVVGVDPFHYQVMISPFPSKLWKPVKDILEQQKIQESKGGEGYILGPGALLITGKEVDIRYTADLVDAYIRGHL